jgi:hypothetical protein
MGSRLRLAVIACHGALTLLLLLATLSGGVTFFVVCAAAAIVAPLAAAAWALLTRRRGAERWVCVLLVPYAGALSVEVVARAGHAPLLSAALLVSVLELGLLLALIRARRPQAARE